MGVTYKPHTVKKGEYLQDIAKKYGWQAKEWRGLYDLKANAKFRKKRRDPNHIEPGDVILIPSVSRKELITGRKILIGTYEAHMKATAPIKAYQSQVEAARKAAKKAADTKKLSAKQVTDTKNQMKKAWRSYKYANDIASICNRNNQADPGLNPFVGAYMCRKEVALSLKHLHEHRRLGEVLKVAEAQLTKDAQSSQKAARKVLDDTRHLPAKVKEWEATHKDVAAKLKHGIGQLEKAMGDTF